MNWLSIFSIFAKPLGAMINNALAAGAGAAIYWGSQHGIDAGVSTPIVGGIALAVSQIISAAAATQGVQIPIINQDTTNGVRVVPAAAADKANIPAVNAPKA